MARPTVRLATRGSDLALRQVEAVRERLEQRRFDVEVVTVRTTGDEIRDELIHRLGKTGAFVRSLDQKVLDGELDAAVHSMKDMPTESPDELIVAAIPKRGSPADALVTPDGTTLSDLPEGATVGTSSLRRRAHLLAERPDLAVEPLRGNVDTRVAKLLAPALQREHERRLEAAGEIGSEEGSDDGDENENENEDEDAPEFDSTPQEWFDDLTELQRRALERDVDTEFDAIVLAEAGLQRLGLDRHVEYQRLDPTAFVPAPGQGAIAVTSLDTDLAEQIHDVVDHPRTRVETTVERTILAELGGGCIAPIGVYAVLQGDQIRTTVAVRDPDGEASVAATRGLDVERYVEAARAFASDLADEGAVELIDRARERAEE